MANERSWSIPGKVFLWGEYAVLAGGSAWIAAMEPRFRLDAVPAGRSATEFAPASPAGRLARWAGERGLGQGLRVRFEDPRGGSGGFGASTAQFALLYQALSAEHPEVFAPGWLPGWDFYRDLTGGNDGPPASRPIPPSGADLAAQVSGGVCRFDPQGGPRCERQPPAKFWSGFLVFSAAEQPGRKAATHLHLTDLGNLGSGTAKWAEGLRAVLTRPGNSAAEAISVGDLSRLGQALEDYGDALAGLGLETPATREDRDFIRQLPGVLGVKGAGAMQADALVVLVDPAASDSGELDRRIRRIEGRGLRFVGTADPSRPGIRREIPGGPVRGAI